MSKEFKELKSEAERQGWRVEPTKSGHWNFYPPDPTQGIVNHAGTPSDHRAMKNTISRLKRAGLKWPPPTKGRR